jgi:hypothetical protein
MTCREVVETIPDRNNARRRAKLGRAPDWENPARRAQLAELASQRGEFGTRERTEPRLSNQNLDVD